MQKKIKSRLAEVIFVIFCLSGSTFSLWQFWKDMNKSLFKLNEKPIATISFKYKTAQRKFIDDVLWDRLRQDSPVYEGDTIRTAPLSEATIYFSDGNIMDLYENTMARITLKEDGAEIDFESGQISVQATNSAVKIKSGSSVVAVTQGAQVAAANSSEKDFQVQVSKGTASVTAESGTIDLAEGSVASLNADGQIQKNYLSISSPSGDEKILNFAKNGYGVDFNWTSDVDTVVLELFDSKEMTKYVERFTYSGMNSSVITMSSGVHWWKMSVTTPNGEEESYTGKINVIQSGEPALIAPSSDYIALYRLKTPSTRFIWTESERATSYQLEISKNPDMSNPLITQRSSQTSSIISSLEAGTYYWRVIPYFAMNGIGLAAPSVIQSFEIRKSGELLKPSLQVPVQNALVSTKVALENGDISYKSIHFSWKDNPEAISYKVRVWPQNKGEVSEIVRETTNNYFEIDTNKTQIANGKWFWQVTTVDVEGNEAVSETREIFAMDSDVELRTVFPPDNYNLAESRAADIRYIWKSNLPFDSELQISRDSKFTDIVYSEKTNSTSMNGRQLSVGTYYWRIVTDIGGSNVETNAKTLNVEPPLDASTLLSPVDGARAIIRPNTLLTFKWNAVKGADYYQIKIFSVNNENDVLYDRNFIESKDGKIVVHDVDLQDFDEKLYSWSVQAFREETLTSSRQSGYLSKSSFVLKKLTPIKLTYPSVGASFDGIDMVKNPDTFKWYSVYEGEPVTVVIYKDRISPKNIYATYRSRSLSMKMPVLYEGSYFWTVKGSTDDDLDISSLETNYFSVGAIPKLAAAKGLYPDNQKYDKNYFRNNKKISFKWNGVKEADYYNLTVCGKTYKVRGTKFELDDLTALKKGVFKWTIEACSEYNGTLFQHGELSSAQFEIDLPEINKVNVKNGGKLYGK